MSMSFEQRAEKLSHLETAPAMALIFEWVKTGVITKAEFNGLTCRVLGVHEPVAYGSGDGHWVRAQDYAIRPDKERFTIKFYGEL